MNFLRDHFEPQSTSHLVAALTIKLGAIILFKDNSEKTVIKAGFGDPHKFGFVSRHGRTAAPWVFEFTYGRELICHPQALIRVKGQDDA